MFSWKICRVLAWFFLLTFSLAVQPATATTNVLAFTHVTVIDATGAPARPDITVLITGDRITAIGKSSKLTPPANAAVVDATGKFLIPGLWDMHVHWYDPDYLPLFIANGVTGIRTMWGFPEHHAWRKQIEQGTLLGPRLFIASTLVDGPKPVWPNSFVAGNAAEGRQAVLQAKQDDADFVKVYSLLPRDAYFAIADEARKQDIPFVGHVPIAVTAEEVSAAGQKSIEHLTGILAACSSRESELHQFAQETLAEFLSTNQSSGTTGRLAMLAYLRRETQLGLDTYSPEKANAVFAEFKKNGTWQCPTLTVVRLIPFGGDPSYLNDPRLKFMPADLRNQWTSTNSGRFAVKPSDVVAFGNRYFQKDLELVGAMQRAGVGILAGTDTGNPFCFPGFSLHDEMALLVQAGLTPMQAVQAATINPARFMGRERDLGTVETGKLADLVVLDANPLIDIANTRKINAVFYGGRLYPKSSLDEMLAKVEALASPNASTPQTKSPGQ
jgi:cytosine/adenosine deaminase-related metal-dependent hydrolase